MILELDIDYGIGTPPRRPRTNVLNIDYQFLPVVPPRVIVKVDGDLVSCSMLIFVDDVLA